MLSKEDLEMRRIYRKYYINYYIGYRQENIIRIIRMAFNFNFTLVNLIQNSVKKIEIEMYNLYQQRHPITLYSQTKSADSWLLSPLFIVLREVIGSESSRKCIQGI